MGLGGQASQAQTTAQKSNIEKPLKNTDVIMMSKAGLGDDIVITKINQAPREELDVSVQALLGLKKKGVSKTVIEAMIKRVDQRTKGPMTVPSQNVAPVSTQDSASASKQPACSANFEKDGGFVRGETKKSFRDYPEAKNRDSLFDSLIRSVMAGGWQVSKSDKETGTIVGVASVRNVVEDVRQFLGGDVTKLTLNVLLRMRDSGGIRVETTLLVPAGTLLPDEEAQTVFCRILGQ